MSSAQRVLEVVKAGDLPGVSQLLDADPALVNARDEQGNSALLLALYYGHKEIADLLLAKGADLNLFEASAGGQTERVKALLAANPRLINAYSHDGFTALHLAAFFGHQAILEFLLSSGANPNAVAKNPMQVVPIHSAAAHYQPEVAEAMVRSLLAHGADVNARQEGGFTALHAAAQSGNLGLLDLLLDSGADINAAASDGKTPLAIARESNKTDAAARLEQRGGG
jgi:uncharacterized protein